MLYLVLLAVACHTVGSSMLIVGMATQNRRLQRIGTSLIFSLTVTLTGIAIAERQPLLPFFQNRPLRVFK